MPTQRILLIEEEPLLALDIEDILAEAQLGEVTHHRNIAAAEQDGFTLAIVEARLGAVEVVAYTEHLVRSGIPVVVMSADRAATEAFPHAVALAKPFDAASLLAACRAAMSRLS
jgi:DNA-binding response OmpR family regulator